jgi:hypothetical protein
MTVAARARGGLAARAWTAPRPIWAEVATFLALMFLYGWLRSLVAPESARVDLRSGPAEGGAHPPGPRP